MALCSHQIYCSSWLGSSWLTWQHKILELVNKIWSQLIQKVLWYRVANGVFPSSFAWEKKLQPCIKKISRTSLRYSVRQTKMAKLYLRVGIHWIFKPSWYGRNSEMLRNCWGCQIHEVFCHCCEILSADIVKENCGDQICGRCRNKQRRHRTWKCFH